MENRNTRKIRNIPRHVEGRIMVGQMPLKNLIIVIPLAAIIIFLAIILFSKLTVFIAIVLLGILAGLFSEFGQKETGLALLTEIIKYQIRGDLIFERVEYEVPVYKRFTKNKIGK